MTVPKTTKFYWLISLLFFAFIDLKASDPNEVCQEVFSRLKSSKGLAPGQAPFLKVVDQLPNPDITIALAVDDMIYLDTKTYELCRKMGSDSLDALAYILSHELAHYIMGHTESHGFIDQVALDEAKAAIDAADVEDRRAKRKVKAILRKFSIQQHEAESDFEAGFISYLAGYNALSVGPRFLEQAYESFSMQTTGGNYQSLQERQEIMRETKARLDTLSGLFEASTYAFMTGDFHQATLGYEAIAKHFVSVDLLHNQALLTIRKYTDKIYASEGNSLIPYELPSVMAPPAASLVKDLIKFETEEQRTAYYRSIYYQHVGIIDEAIEKLDYALIINPQYHAAGLNKAVALYLRHLVGEKWEWKPDHHGDDRELSLASSIRTKNRILDGDEKHDDLLGRCYVMMAIIYDMKVDKSEAKNYLDLASQFIPESEILHINQQVILVDRTARLSHYLSNPTGLSPHQKFTGWRAQERLNLDDFLEQERDFENSWYEQYSAFDPQVVLREKCLYESEGFIVQRRMWQMADLPQGRIHRFVYTRGREKIIEASILCRRDTLINAADKTLIRQGLSAEELINYLGQPSLRYDTPHQSFWQYRQVIFAMIDGEIDHWILY